MKETRPTPVATQLRSRLRRVDPELVEQVHLRVRHRRAGRQSEGGERDVESPGVQEAQRALPQRCAQVIVRARMVHRVFSPEGVPRVRSAVRDVVGEVCG